jgi:hypothetical protein
MKITTVKRLQETFLNKVCTVLTLSVSKQNFTDVQFADFFTGIIEFVDDDGVFLRHHITGCKSFYPWPQVAAILEEQVLDEKDPNYQEIVDEIKSSSDKRPVVAPVNPSATPYVDPVLMANLAKQAQDFKR